MKIFKTIEFLKLNSDAQAEYFANLCSNEDNESEVKKLHLVDKIKRFFKPSSSEFIDNGLLMIGLISAIEHNQKALAKTIVKLIDDKKTPFDKYKAQYYSLFNCATYYGNMELVNYMNQKYSIIKKALNQDVNIKMSNNGLILGYVDSHSSSNQNHFTFHPFKFNVWELNDEKVMFLIEENKYEINPSIVEKTFIDAFIEGKKDVILFMKKNPIIKKIIENSTVVNVFLNEPSEYREMKALIELEEELKSNPNKSGKKLKV